MFTGFAYRFIIRGIDEESVVAEVTVTFLELVMRERGRMRKARDGRDMGQKRRDRRTRIH